MSKKKVNRQLLTRKQFVHFPFLPKTELFSRVSRRIIKHLRVHNKSFELQELVIFLDGKRDRDLRLSTVVGQ